MVTIRSRLLLLVLSVLLPGGMVVAWLISRTYEGERQAHERVLRETTRALSQVVDLELNRRSMLAKVLAQSRWLDDAPNLSPADLQQFEQQARRGLQGVEGWLVLRTPDRVLLDTRLPEGVMPPAVSVSADPWVDIGQVRPLQALADPAAAYAAVVEPVRRHNRVLLNLQLTMRPAELQRIIDRQHLPAGWTGVILDSSGRVVGRQPGGSSYVGRPATPDVRAALAADTEGLFHSVTLDGVHTTAYRHTQANGWSFITGMPRAEFAGQLPASVVQVALGSMALLGLAVMGTLWMSRRIVVPVQALKLAAAQLQTGQPVTYRPSGIVECDEVASALADAARTLQQGRQDLERQVADAVERTRQAEQRVSHSQRVEALGRLTGGVAHDFNNLLGVISNSAHLIQRQAQRHALPDLQMPAAATLRAVEVGSRLTQHLLRFAGRRPVRPQAVQLTRYLPDLQDLLRSVLGRQIELDVQVAPDTWPVRVDSAELELALINLALNARDAMPQGGSLRLVARNADPGDTDDADGLAPGPHVLVSVADDGPGMAADLAGRVFEPFVTTKPIGKGTGLGLSQVHGFCVQAGGTARLASTPGQGTKVTLLLPATEDAAQADTVRRNGDVAPGQASLLQGLRVLLVEDNLALGDTTAALLQSHGTQVLRAADASEALRQLAAQPAVDLVLSDVVMPGAMDGLALARQLRQDRPLLPVVLVTGYSANAAGVHDFTVLRKPYGLSDLLTAIEGALIRPVAVAAP